MKLLNIKDENIFKKHIEHNVSGDYIYDYPPRQSI